VSAAGQLGAAGRYEPLEHAEMQSGNNFHRFELHVEKNECLALPASSQHDSTEVCIDLNF